MFVEEIRRAVQACQRGRLPELSAAVWKGFAAGAVTEEEAQGLAEMIEARTPDHGCLPPWLRASPRPRMRRWPSSFGRSPPRARAGSTAAAIAGRAGVSTSSARNAVREARRRGILHVQERRIPYDRNDPNRITIASRELSLWIRTRSRADRSGGGAKSVIPTTNHLIPYPPQPATTAWKAGTFGEAGRMVWARWPEAKP